jgi:hypothetical protein
MKTRQDLIAATLYLLNAIAAGQTPEAEDVDAIDVIIDGKLEELSIRGIAFFPDKDEFEDFYIDPLSIILADTAAPGFGQPRNPDSRLYAERTMRDLRNSSRVDADVTPSQYF